MKYTYSYKKATKGSGKLAYMNSGGHQIFVCQLENWKVEASETKAQALDRILRDMGYASREDFWEDNTFADCEIALSSHTVGTYTIQLVGLTKGYAVKVSNGEWINRYEYRGIDEAMAKLNLELAFSRALAGA